MKKLRLRGHGERVLPSATTDVWVLDKQAYIGPFNTLCGDGSEENGITGEKGRLPRPRGACA